MLLNRKNKTPRLLSGFTLIEILLALGIFSSLALSANQVLRNVLTSNAQSQEVGDELKALQQTLLIMDSDFRQILARSFRETGQQKPEKMLELGEGLLSSDSEGVLFVRGGWINPQQLFERGEVVKVGYRTQNNTLERLRWIYPDDSASIEAAINPLYQGVKSITFSVSQDGKNWLTSWNEPNEMPKAIRVTFETDRFGKLSRIYLLPAQKLDAKETRDEN